MLRNTPSFISVKLFWLLLLLVPISGGAQDLDHVPGAFLIKPMIGVSMEEVVSEIQPLSHQSIQVSAVCTTPFPIWLIQTDAALLNEYELLETLRRSKTVEIAQFNQFLQDRLLPNDPQFYYQWQYINLGNNGGTPNADLDAELAWDISTGGLTDAGDTIVVCIIEEGLDIGHPDLLGNQWHNCSEIPNNNIDDDGNGYVDDYQGWNVATLNDDLQSNPNAGWHGTPVSGIIGAKGNNNTGVTGINWDVKIMTVVRGSTMDQTLAAYAYPYAFRKKYNETSGAEGAFVVATNSSWGIDFGQPEEAPLWCAFYDSLGTVGILNCAATANNNYNVDLVGDLPTACTSDFLISVTNIDRNDQKNNNAAFGAASIDLGAYGTDIWTIKKNNSYGSFTGTSAAAPSVAGAIALLYSAPCPDISWYAKHNPASTAQVIKSYLMNGTTPISSLSGKTVSGGRLHLKAAIDQLMDACAFTDCFAPVQATVNTILETSAAITWLSPANVTSVDFRYRVQNNPLWIYNYNASSPFSLNNLEVCTTYEYQLRSNCGSNNSGYTSSLFFKTDGCCEPPSAINILSISGNSVSINWANSSAITGYKTRYRLQGALNWIENNSTTPYIGYTDLTGCSTYEMQIQAVCNNTLTDFSESFFWQTSACDNCLEYNYCPVSVSPDPITWISYVQFNDLENSSGAGMNGYSDFTGTSATLTPGFSYDLNLETDFNFLELLLYFQVWIDLNQNGEFEDEELLLENNNPADICQASIHIPVNAVIGTTRMRIAGRSVPGPPCGEGGLAGEVEDYCVTILESTTCIPPQGVNGTPGENQITISWLNNYADQEFDIYYREVNDPVWLELYSPLHLIHLENLKNCTEYEFKIRAICDGEHSLFTTVQKFTTLGCGSCLDLSYCVPEEEDTHFEWISNFKLNEIDHGSGAEGYGDFSNNTSTDLFGLMSYNLEITPGFAGDAYEEFYTVWIDYNHDGSFNDISEKVFQTTTATAAPLVTGNFEVPFYALEGSTRLRVSMKYYSVPTSACESTPFFGEVEDYCINILSSSTESCSNPIGMEPTLFSDSSFYVVWDAVTDAVSYQFRYKSYSTDWIVNTSQNNYILLDHLMPCQEYEYQVRTICANGLSAYSASEFVFLDCESTASNEINGTDKPIVFPNPFKEKLFIQFPNKDLKMESVKVYNAVGQSVKEFREVLMEDGMMELGLRDLESGVYFLEVDGIVLKVVRI